jgi:hypothetical protein
MVVAHVDEVDDACDQSGDDAVDLGETVLGHGPRAVLDKTQAAVTSESRCQSRLLT